VYWLAHMNKRKPSTETTEIEQRMKMNDTPFPPNSVYQNPQAQLPLPRAVDRHQQHVQYGFGNQTFQVHNPTRPRNVDGEPPLKASRRDNYEEASGTQATTEAKRLKERERRKVISDSIAELRAIIPTSFNADKLNQVNTMTVALKYIRYLQARVTELEAQIPTGSPDYASSALSRDPIHKHEVGGPPSNMGYALEALPADLSMNGYHQPPYAWQTHPGAPPPFPTNFSMPHPHAHRRQALIGETRDPVFVGDSNVLPFQTRQPMSEKVEAATAEATTNNISPSEEGGVQETV